MKKIITLLSVFIILGNISLAQEVTEESYKKAVDYLNCKCMEISLKDDDRVQDFFKKTNNCQSVDSDAMKQIITSINKTKTLELFGVINNFKNKNPNKSDIEKTIEFLSNEIFQSARLSDFSNNHPNEIKTLKPLLKDHFENLIIPISNDSQEGTEEAQNSDDEGNQTDSSQTDRSLFSDKFSDFLLIICFLLVAFLLYKNFTKTNLNSNYDSIINRLIESRRMNDHFSSNNHLLTANRPEVSKNEIKDIHDRIRDLESQISLLSNKLDDNNKSLKENSGSNYNQSPTIIADTGTDLFYLSTPNADGSFNESSVSLNYKGGASIYKFKKLSNSKASFQIDDKESSVRLALQFPDKNIDPVCDALNAFNPKATKIKTDQLGEAELQNGKWVVTKKSKIRYEG